MWPWTVAPATAARDPGDGPHARRLERRQRRGHGDRACAGRARLGRRRLDPLSVGAERPVRDQERSATDLAGPDHHDGWNGLSVYGPLARTVADAALFLDATSRSGPTRVRAALEESPRPLRVAVSFKPPRGSLARSAASSGGRRETAELLRSLGHEVIEREVDMPFTLNLNVTIRYLRGLRHDIGRSRADLLERDTRRMAALGGLCDRRHSRKGPARRGGARRARGPVFDGADVVLMPMIRAGAAHRGPDEPRHGVDLQPCGDRGRLHGPVERHRPARCVGAHRPGFGRPAAGGPALRTGGRRVTSLRLAAQIEEARPWAQIVRRSISARRSCRPEHPQGEQTGDRHRGDEDDRLKPPLAGVRPGAEHVDHGQRPPGDRPAVHLTPQLRSSDPATQVESRPRIARPSRRMIPRPVKAGR